MNYDFETFREAIETATARGDFPDAAKLILMGRISYAAERGDISINQGWELQALLGDGFAERHSRDMEIAGFGDVLEENSKTASAR